MNSMFKIHLLALFYKWTSDLQFQLLGLRELIKKHENSFYKIIFISQLLPHKMSGWQN